MALSDEIEVFLAVVQTASISEAAKLLFISQSTVSYRLKLLEDELDCRLIDRSRGQGHCELTRDGQDFLLIAEKSRNIHQEIVRFKNDTKVSTLRIGSPESVACYLFDELLDQPSSKGQKVVLFSLIGQRRQWETGSITGAEGRRIMRLRRMHPAWLSIT